MARYSDEQWSMIEDSIDKKRTAASAFKQRTHCGKGGSVKFPSDFMSRKEFKAMSGECITYANLKKPMTWDEFVELPNDIKVEYIKSIRDRFGAPDKYISDMFGVAQGLFSMWLKDLKLNLKLDGGDWNKEAFLAWTTGAEPELVKENEAEPVAAEENKYTWGPMSWEEFKMLSDENKKDYVRWIRESFGAPDKAIGTMLGCSQHTISVHLRRLDFSSPATNGKTKWDKEGFAAWKNSKKVESKAVEAVIDEPVVKEATPVIEPMVRVEGEWKPAIIKTAEKTEPVMAIPAYGELNFDCNAEAALNTLRQLLGNNRVRLSVHWDVVVE